MTISEINKLLKDPKMQNKNTNLKIIGNGGGRVTNRDLLIEIQKSLNKVSDRLDKLENLVVTEFKKHG